MLGMWKLHFCVFKESTARGRGRDAGKVGKWKAPCCCSVWKSLKSPNGRRILKRTPMLFALFACHLNGALLCFGWHTQYCKLKMSLSSGAKLLLLMAVVMGKQKHRITESLRLGKTSKTIYFNSQPIATMPTNHVPKEKGAWLLSGHAPPHTFCPSYLTGNRIVGLLSGRFRGNNALSMFWRLAVLSWFLHAAQDAPSSSPCFSMSTTPSAWRGGGVLQK